MTEVVQDSVELAILEAGLLGVVAERGFGVRTQRPRKRGLEESVAQHPDLSRGALIAIARAVDLVAVRA